MDAKEREDLFNRIKELTALLAEHCDAVQVLASVVEADGTTTIFNYGLGNQYARLGMAREYLEIDRARTHWGEKPADPPEDSESWKS